MELVFQPPGQPMMPNSMDPTRPGKLYLIWAELVLAFVEYLLIWLITKNVFSGTINMVALIDKN